MDKREKLVILDRDGVINRDSDDYIKSPDEWIPIENSLQAISDLVRAGYKVAVATNQSGIARRFFDQFVLAQIHQKMCEAVELAGGILDGVFYCPHGPDEGCKCRKPETGLLDSISREFSVSLQGVPLVGDSLRDMQAARKAGCLPILVKTGKGVRTVETCNPTDLKDVVIVDDLMAAAGFILNEMNSRPGVG